MGFNSGFKGLMRNGFSFVVSDSVPPVWKEARWARNPFGLR
jgi:hypothetical protein